MIGYDGRRGTLIIRDPYWRNAGEAITDKVLSVTGRTGRGGWPWCRRPTGPAWRKSSCRTPPLVGRAARAGRGPGRAPPARRPRRVYERMRAAAAGHLLTREARRRLALYDCNPTEHLAAVEQLLEIEPGGPVAAAGTAVLPARPGPPRRTAGDLPGVVPARRTRTRSSGSSTPRSCGPTPGGTTTPCGCCGGRSAAGLREAANYFILANVYADQRRFDEALELYRFATCLGDKEEQFAQAYFTAATWLQGDRRRPCGSCRTGSRGSAASPACRPGRLFSAYMQLDRTTEAVQVLEQAMEHAAGRRRVAAVRRRRLLVVQHGEHAAGGGAGGTGPREDGRPGRGSAPRPAWRPATAGWRTALGYWRQILEIQPLALDAHRAVARLLAETRARRRRWPIWNRRRSSSRTHHPLHELWIEWMRDEPREAREPVIRRVLAMNPDDAWVRRELALVLADQRLFEEAWQQVDAAAQLDPLSPSLFMVRAHVLQCQQRIDEAKAELRQAIELSVDNDLAISELVDLCLTAGRAAGGAGVRPAAAGPAGDLRRRAVGVPDARPRDARGGRTAAALREALAARPDLWHAWSAVSLQLLDMNEADGGLGTGRSGDRAVPAGPAAVAGPGGGGPARGDDAGERRPWKRPTRSVPAGATPCGRCASARAAGRLRPLAAAAGTGGGPRSAGRAQPPDAGRGPVAGRRTGGGLGADPSPGPAGARLHQAWGRLNQWADELGCPERTLETVRELTARRGGEARSWLMLAKVLDAPEQLDERLAALDRTVTLNPRCAEAYDLRAVALARAAAGTKPWRRASPRRGRAAARRAARPRGLG